LIWAQQLQERLKEPQEQRQQQWLQQPWALEAQ
jgi:hypothetical protein